MDEILSSGWVQELVGGFFTSIIFLLGLWIMRPRVKIGPNLALTEKDGIDVVIVKVYNKSTFFRIYDLNFVMSRVQELDGNIKLVDVPIINYADVMYLGRRPSIFSHDTKKASATHAIQLHIDKKYIDAAIQDNACHMSFKVQGVHGFSGMIRVKKQTFRNIRSLISKGEFVQGSKVTINPTI